MFDTTTIIVYISVFLVFALIVLGSYTLMKIADRLDIKGYWLALIPIVQAYVFGKIIKKIDFSGHEIPHAEYVLLAWPFALLGTLFLPSGKMLSGYFYAPTPSTFWTLVQAILLFVLALIYLYGLNTFFLMFTHSNIKSRLYTFVGGVTIILIPVFILLVRNTPPIGWVGEVNLKPEKNRKKIKKGINKSPKKSRSAKKR